MTQTTNSEQPSLVYVGVGVGDYASGDYQPLDKAVTEVSDVSKILSEFGYDTHILKDPDRSVALAKLDDLLQQEKLSRNGSLVVFWAGHGEPEPEGGLNLITRDTKPKSAALITPKYIADQAARSGASQILLIFDTCFSGGGVLQALEKIDAILSKLRPITNETTGVVVVASTLDYQKAKDGVFGDLITKLLREGPDDPKLQQRWSVHSLAVEVSDFLKAIDEEWDRTDAQRPKLIQLGVPRLTLPNPLYEPPSPKLMDAHLRNAARGGEPGEKDFYFTGRVAELNRIVAWIRNGEPSAFAVTGPPGIGKSAILGRIVGLSNHEERTQLFAQEPVLEHADPGEGSISAHVHALRYTVERLVTEIAEQLVRNGVLPADAERLTNRTELHGAIQRSGKRPVIVVDGLNESGTESWRMAEDVLRTLSEVSLVLVGTQDLPPAEGLLSLVKALGAKEVIDLEAPDIQKDAESDLRRYIEKRLAHVVIPATDLSKVTEIVLEFCREQPAGDFLLARFITTQMRRSPVDTSQPQWEKRLVCSIEETIESFVANAPPLIRSGKKIPHAARELLSALAWSKGPGLPADIWPIMATALSPTETRYERGDVFDLLPYLKEYVIEDGQGGQAVYRLLHQWLADHFQSSLAPSPEPDATDERAINVARALVDYYQELLKNGDFPQKHPYLWRYTWWHCADAGVPGIEVFRSLVKTDKTFLPKLAHALAAVSKSEGNMGRWESAASAAQETVEIYRNLVKDDDTLRSDLADALVMFGHFRVLVGKSQEAVDAAYEAAEIYRSMDLTNPAVSLAFAMALTLLSLGEGTLGQAQEALESATDAVSLIRQLGGDNPAFAPELAFTLSVLSLGYSQTGRSKEGLETAEEAVALFRTLDTKNTSVSLLFGWALSLLGMGYSQTGRPQEGVSAAEEAVVLFRSMDADNPATHLPFGLALSVLGQNYSQTGQVQDGLAAAQEAVALFQTMDTENPAVRWPLAWAQTILGVGYSQTGQLKEGLEAAKEAVAIYRTIDTTNPAIGLSFASALTVLGLVYSQTGQPLEGLKAALEAVDLFQTIDTTNPATHFPFGWALTVLGLCYSQMGQLQEAVEAAKEAADLYRNMDNTNLAVRLPFGLALTVLGLGYSQTGQAQTALAVAKEAVDLFRAMGTTNLTVCLPFGLALTVLGLGYAQGGQLQQALDAAQEAVALYKKLDIANPSVRGPLGWALNVLSQGYSQVGKRQEALDAAMESVNLYRNLDTANPAVRLLFGLALTTLTQCYYELGQWQDALTAGKEALENYRTLDTTNPAVLEILVSALSDLGKIYLKLGRGAEIEAEWDLAVNSFAHPDDKAFLLFERAQTPDLEMTMAVKYLLQAQSFLTGEDKSLAAGLHKVCRSIRAANPTSFDSTWQSEGGGELPQWLVVDSSLLGLIREWISAEPTEAEQDFLNKHIGEIPAEYDSVVFDEIALGFPDPSFIEFYRDLFQSAREMGVDEAYKLRFALGLLWDWLSADWPTKRTMLQGRREELIGDECQNLLQELLDSGEESSDLIICHQRLLGLAQTGKEELAFQAIEDSTRASSTLHDLLLAGDIDALEAVARAVSLAEESEQAKALPCFYLAIALALSNQPDQALKVVSEARRLDEKQVTAWLDLLLSLASKHPELISLSQALIASSKSEEGDS